MQSGYYSATGGMVAQFERLNNISNNLANVATNGFKKQQFIIGDYVRLYEEKQPQLPLENHTREASGFIHRGMTRVPHIVEAYTDFKMGTLENTSNPLDLAIKEDDMFMAVQTPQGVRFTRDGTFSLNEDGELVTKKGFPVLASDFQTNSTPITFPPEAEVNIDKDGVIYVNGETYRQLLVVKPENLKSLQPEADNLFIPDITDNFAPQLNTGVVVQGFVEKSNVQAIEEMTGLIETSRLVDMYQKVMDTQMNDLNRDAITKLATKA